MKKKKKKPRRVSVRLPLGKRPGLKRGGKHRRWWERKKQRKGV